MLTLQQICRGTTRATIVAAAIDDVCFTCDSYGVVEAWYIDTLVPLRSKRTPNNAVPSSLLAVGRSTVLAVFPTFVTRRHSGGEVHAFVASGQSLARAPVLETRTTGVLGPCCANGTDVVLSCERKLCLHTLRWKDLRLPLRLEIVFDAPQAWAGLEAQNGLVIAVSDDATVSVWDSCTGAALASLGWRANVSRVAFGDRSFVTYDGALRVWSLLDGAIDQTWELACDKPSALLIERGRLHVVIQGKLQTWSLRDGAAIARCELPARGLLRNANDRLVVCGEDIVTFVIHDRQSPCVVALGDFTALACRGETLVAVGRDCVAIRTEQSSLLPHDDEVRVVALAPRRWAAGYASGKVVATTKTTAATASGSAVTALSCSEDHLCVGYANGSVLSGAGKLAPHFAPIVLIAELDDSLVVVLSSDGELRIWEETRLRWHQSIASNTSATLLDKDTRRFIIAVGTTEGRLETWGPIGACVAHALNCSARVHCGAVTSIAHALTQRDKHALATASTRDASVVRWRRDDGGLRPLQRIVLAHSPRALGFYKTSLIALVPGAVVEIAADFSRDEDWSEEDSGGVPVCAKQQDLMPVVNTETERCSKKSRPRVVGGRTASTKPRGATPAEPAPAKKREAQTNTKLALVPTVYDENTAELIIADKCDATLPGVFLTKRKRERMPTIDKERVRSAPALPGTNSFVRVVIDERNGVFDDSDLFPTTPDSTILTRDDEVLLDSKEWHIQVAHKLPALASEKVEAGGLIFRHNDETAKAYRRPRRFESDRRTLDLVPGAGLCAAPKSSSYTVVVHSNDAPKKGVKVEFKSFVPSHVFAVPYWDGRGPGENDTGPPSIERYGLTTALRRRKRCKMMAPLVFENDEDDLTEIVKELHLLKRGQKNKREQVRGVRGYNFGTILDANEGEDDSERRRRMKELEAMATALMKKQEQQPEEDESVDEEYEAWLKAMREASAADAAPRPEDEEARLLASLDSDGKRGLFRVFKRLANGQLLVFPRLATWGPCQRAMRDLSVSRQDLKGLWRKAHRNLYGGDRGNFEHFVVFAGLLRDVVASRELGPPVSSVRVVRSEANALEIQVELLDEDEDEEDELNLAYEESKRFEIRVLAYTRAHWTPPTYEAALLDENAAVAEPGALVTLTELEPATEYVVYAMAVVVSPLDSVPPRGDLQRTADERLLQTRVDAATTKDGSIEEDIVISWDGLTPEQQRTELLAALKSKDACAAAREMALEVPSPADARLSVQKNDPNAKERWDAWSKWWPTSEARRGFLVQEMLFAAKQSPEIRDAAAADGAKIEVADVLLAQDGKLDDPERRQRWRNFQRWYCGMPVEAARRTRTTSRRSSSSLKDDARTTSRSSSSSLEGDTTDSSTTQRRASRASHTVLPSRRSSLKKESPSSKPAPAEEAPPASGEQLRARMAARNQFLNARTSKVAEMRSALEKTKTKQQTKPGHKKSLKAYIKLVIFQQRMQKMLGSSQGGNLDTEVDIFADVDATAFQEVLNKAAKLDAVTEAEDAVVEETIVEPPAWKSLSREEQDHELQLACVDPRVIDAAIDALVAAPEPEDWASLRATRIDAFAAWYSRSEVRGVVFVDEISAAATDDIVRRDARDSEVSDASFRAWYAKARATRADYVKRRANALLVARRVLCLPQLPFFLYVCAPPPLACLAREPPQPQRYVLYPSRTPEAWCVPEILRWYDSDVEGMRKALSGPLDKWRREEWLRREEERRRESRRLMAWEDERAHLLRTAHTQVGEADANKRTTTCSTDATAADDVVARMRRRHDGRQLIYTSPLATWDFDIPGKHYALGCGLTADEDSDREMSFAAETLAREHEAKMKRREEERLKREAEEQRQREADEKRRRLEREAAERQRIIEALAKQRDRKLALAALAATDRQRRAHIERQLIDADTALAVVTIAQARLDERRRNEDDETISSPPPPSESEEPPVSPVVESVSSEESRHSFDDIEKRAFAPFEPAFDDEIETPVDTRSRNLSVMPYAEHAIRQSWPSQHYVLGQHDSDTVVEVLRAGRLDMDPMVPVAVAEEDPPMLPLLPFVNNNKARPPKTEVAEWRPLIKKVTFGVRGRRADLHAHDEPPIEQDNDLGSSLYLSITRRRRLMTSSASTPDLSRD